MSNLDLLLPLWGFIVVMVATPGPANLLLMSAGAQQGFLRTLPFIGGLVVGKLLLNLALALGLVGLLPEGSVMRRVFILLSASYMAYLALRNWTPSAIANKPSRFSFLAGTIVHPLSPKTWVMATLALSSFSNGFDSPGERLLVVPLSFLIAQVFFHSLWCLAGAALSRVFQQSLVLHRALIVLTLGVILWAVLR